MREPAEGPADRPAGRSADRSIDRRADDHGRSTAVSGMDPQGLAIVAHVSVAACFFVGFFSILGPLLIWLLPSEKDAFLIQHAKEALNFQITAILASIVLGIAIALLVVVGAIATAGVGLIVVIPLIVLVSLGLLIVVIVWVVQAATAASRGEAYRYPICLRVIQ